MSPRGAFYCSLLRDSDGPIFPDVGVNGGFVGGVPVAVSKAASNKFILVDADAVGVWDGGMLTDHSTETALQMNDTPSAGPANVTSLFQRDDSTS
jgi:hypothetical protein